MAAQCLDPLPTVCLDLGFCSIYVLCDPDPNSLTFRFDSALRLLDFFAEPFLLWSRHTGEQETKCK